MGLTEDFIIYKQFLSSEEILILKDHAVALHESKLMRPETWYKDLYKKDEIGRFAITMHPYCQTWPPLLNTIVDRVIQHLGVSKYFVDPYYGFNIHYMLPNAGIQVHTDKYFSSSISEYMCSNCAHVRFNIMVNRDINHTYHPYVALQFDPNKTVDKQEMKLSPKIVNTGDAWSFPASKIPHGTPTLVGKEPRIVYQFGFAIPEKI